VISIRDDAVEWLLARTLADRSYGARPLRRAIQRHIEDALSEAFIRGQIRGGEAIVVGVKDGGCGTSRLDGRGAVGMRRGAVLGVWLLSLPAAEARAQAPEAGVPVVEAVEIQNNQYVQRETLLFYIATKPGDVYDERKLREDFRRLWDTGFLDDLQIEVVDGQRGKLVRFKVTERKRIQIVDYRGSKDLTTSTIEDALKERDAQVKIDTFYDPAKARKVEAIIKEMLAQKGRPFATVKHEAKNIGGAGQQLSFVVDEGPKAKVNEIAFDGNSVFSDGKLRGRMKKIKEPGFFNLSWLGARRPTPRTSGWGARRTRGATAGGSRTTTSTTATSRRGSGSRGSATRTARAASSRRSRSS
jgi:hypothetical protein